MRRILARIPGIGLDLRPGLPGIGLLCEDSGQDSRDWFNDDSGQESADWFRLWEDSGQESGDWVWI